MTPRPEFGCQKANSQRRPLLPGRHIRGSRGRLIGSQLEALERREVPAVLAIVTPDTNPVGQTFTAGTPFAGQIATFVANDGATDSTRYQATIDWGDNSTSPGTVVYDANTGNFDVDATHTYRAPAQTAITVRVDDFWDSTHTSQSANLTVLDQALTPTASEPSIAAVVQGAPIASQDVFTFKDGNSLALASDFTATIHWGDGTATAADSIAKDAEGVYHVLGSHTYQHPAPAGGYQVTASVADGPSTLALANAIGVAPAPLQLGASTVSLAVTSANAQGEAIIPAGTVVGSFTQAGLPDPTASYATSASFVKFTGSGTATPVSVRVPSTAGGNFVVTTAVDTVVSPFLNPGSTPFALQVADQVAGTLATAQGRLEVSDVAAAPMLVQPTVTITQGQVFAGPVATFAIPFGRSQDLSGQYVATIDWGDGTAPTTGQVQAGSTAGSYVVVGRHTYADVGAKVAGQAAGTDPISVTVRRTGADGASQSIGNTALVLDAPIALTVTPITLPVTASDSTGQAAIPAGTVVGTFTQVGAARLTTAFAGSTATFPGASAATPLSFTYDAASGLYTASTAAPTPIPPFLTPGSGSFSVRIADAIGGATATGQAGLAVVDVAPVASVVPPGAEVALGSNFSGPVATFTLPFGAGQDLSGQYVATIDWGDGSLPTLGTVVAGSTPGTYSVDGSHTYAEIGSPIAGQFAGTHLVTVAVQRVGTGGAAMVTQDTVRVDDLPIAVAGAMDPATIVGVVQGAAVTHSTTPTFNGTSEPGATIRLYATMVGTNASIPVGQATTDAAGNWTITATPLGDGTYTVAATAVDAIGVASAVGQILPNATQGLLSVQRARPEVGSVRFNGQTGMVMITYVDAEGPLVLPTLTNRNAYRVTTGASKAAVAMASPTVLAADPLGHSATIGIKLPHAQQFRSNQIKLAIAGSAITDGAGNSLDGDYSTSVRSGSSARPAATAIRVGLTSHPKGHSVHAARFAAARHHHG